MLYDVGLTVPCCTDWQTRKKLYQDSVTFVGDRVFVDPYPQMAYKRNEIRAATKTGIQHYRDIADSVKDLPISCGI
jgi:hypothetical protein